MAASRLKAHIHVDDSRAHEGLRAASIEVPGRPARSLEFQSYDGPLSSTAGCDAFLLGGLLLLMEEAADVHIHGAVTKRCIDNIYELQDVWVRWRPEKYSKVLISADSVMGGRPEAGPAISAFSGGADASFTVQRHSVNNAPGTAELRAVVFVHGFDIDARDEGTFKKARERGELMLEGLGLKSFGLRTNLRAIGQDWGDVFGLAVASCLALYQDSFSVGLIGSSEPYDELVLPWGSSPVTDHLYSTGLMDMRHDGAGFSRTDKIASLAEWDAASRYIRVCWQGASLDRNCGKCEKCIRTFLNFLAAGVHDPQCFEQLPSRAEVRGLRAQNRAQINELQSIIRFAEDGSIAGDWIADARVAMRLSRLRLAVADIPGVKKAVSSLKAAMGSKAVA